MKNNNSVQRCDFRMHDIIDGKYRVERVLGISQNDQKFKVIDSGGNEYVLKLLKLWEVDPQLRQRMIACSDSEIKSCQIKSNYLTRIVKTGIVKGNPYLLTEYCKSVDLSHFFRSAQLNLVKTVKEILYGLRDLHRSGKVHCQLTPENILVADSGNVMLTNYVILGERSKALISHNKTLHSRFVDKAWAYQAPELYRLEKCSTILPTIDIFSFGVILFQILTGELPYGKLVTESDWIHYQSRAKSNDWNRNSLLRHDQRELWMSVLERCLSADADGRAKNVDEILSLLPKDEYHYVSVPNSRVNAPCSIINGVLIRIMQGDEFDMCYRLTEIMQSPRRIITIGRADNSVFNMIPLSEMSSAYISRRHCTIELDDETDTWYVRDGQWDKEAKNKWVRSLNGTYVNSEKISEEGHKIIPGDIISVGDVKLRVEGY